jgi:hypothetical protein
VLEAWIDDKSLMKLSEFLKHPIQENQIQDLQKAPQNFCLDEETFKNFPANFPWILWPGVN